MVEVFYALTLSLSSVSYVKMGTSESLLTLKKKAKADYDNVVWCEAEDLELYLTRLRGDWLTYNEMQKVTITPLGLEYEGQALTQLPQDAQLSLELIGLSNTDFTQPSDEACAVGNRFVHVIVVAPQARQLPALREHLDMVVRGQYRTINEYRATYAIADFPFEVLEEWKESCRFSTKLIEIEETLEDSVNGFAWSDGTIVTPDERRECMEYMKEHLASAFERDGKQRFFLEDTADKGNLLSVDDTYRMEFALTGTAGMVIVDRMAHQYHEEFAGLHFVIEVKKDVASNLERFRRQTLLELIAADLKSDKRRAPMGLLTDLNKTWYLVYSRGDNCHATSALPSERLPID